MLSAALCLRQSRCEARTASHDRLWLSENEGSLPGRWVCGQLTIVCPPGAMKRTVCEIAAASPLHRRQNVFWISTHSLHLSLASSHPSLFHLLFLAACSEERLKAWWSAMVIGTRYASGAGRRLWMWRWMETNQASKLFTVSWPLAAFLFRLSFTFDFHAPHLAPELNARLSGTWWAAKIEVPLASLILCHDVLEQIYPWCACDYRKISYCFVLKGCWWVCLRKAVCEKRGEGDKRISYSAFRKKPLTWRRNVKGTYVALRQFCALIFLCFLL